MLLKNWVYVDVMPWLPLALYWHRATAQFGMRDWYEIWIARARLWGIQRKFLNNKLIIHFYMFWFVIFFLVIFFLARNSYKLKLSSGERRKKRRGKWRNGEVLHENYNHNMKNYNNNDKQRLEGKWKPRMVFQIRSKRIGLTLNTLWLKVRYL